MGPTFGVSSCPWQRPLTEEWFKVEEAAEYLKVSEAHIRELIRLKKLRAYEEGRRGGYRILKEDINTYIDNKMKSGSS